MVYRAFILLILITSLIRADEPPTNSDAPVDAMIANLKSCSRINDSAMEAIVKVGRKALPKLLERYKLLSPHESERGWVLVAIARIDPDSVPNPNEFMKQPMLPTKIMSQILVMMGDRGINFMLDQVYPRGQQNKDVRVDLRCLPKGEATVRAIMSRLTTADERQASIYAQVLQNAARPEDLPLLLKDFSKIPAGNRTELSGVMAVLLRDNAPVQKRLMSDSDAGVRRIAAQSYYNRELDADTVDTLLTVWAKENDEDVRKAIVRSIQGYGGKVALGELIKRADTLPEARQAEALLLMRDLAPREARQLEPLLASNSVIVRAAAIEVLAADRFFEGAWPSPAAEKLAVDPSPEVRAALARTLRMHDGKTLPPLVLKMLSDANVTVRLAAARSAVGVRFNTFMLPDAPPEIVTLLKDPDSQVRAVVRHNQVFSLAKVVAPFKEMLAGDKWQQCSALEVLARGASPELQSMILELMKSPDALVRSYAAGAAGGLPPTTESAMATAKVALGDADPTVRWAALQSLGMLRNKLLTAQKTVDISIPVHAVRATSGPTTSSALSKQRMIRWTLPIRLPFDPKTADDAVILATAFGGIATDATASTLLDWLGSNDERKAVAAVEVMLAWVITDPDMIKTLSVEWPKRPQLARAIYGAYVYRPNFHQFARDGVDGLPVDKDLQTLAVGSDRAAMIARFAIARTPPQSTPSVDVATALKDNNALVRILAIRTLSRSPGAIGPEQRKEVRDLIFKALEDSDLSVVIAARAVASSNSLFGDGSFRTDIPTSVRQACMDLRPRLADCEPCERQSLVKASLTAAGDSSYMIGPWIDLLHDLDPTVRALAAKGLHHYGDQWLEMRLPRRELPSSKHQ